MNPGQAAVLGALVADAASLGLHWLYDAGRLRDLQLSGVGRGRRPVARLNALRAWWPAIAVVSTACCR